VEHAAEIARVLLRGKPPKRIWNHRIQVLIMAPWIKIIRVYCWGKQRNNFYSFGHR
jgi:hypothetical protein